MIRRFTSSPKPASRVARITSSALGVVDALGQHPQAVAHRVELREVAATPRPAGSGSRSPARARSVGQDTSTTSAPASTSRSTDSWKRASTPAW